MGVIGMGYVIVSLSIQARLPSDGVLLTEFMTSGLRVATRLDATMADLKKGDEIVAIDGVSIWEWGERSWRGEPAPAWHVGQTIPYEVRRDQTLRTVMVTLQPFPVERLPLLRFGVYVMAIISLVIGTYMVWHYPAEAAARLLFLSALCLALNLLLHFQVMTLVHPGLFVIESILKFLTRALLFSTVCHLLLIFPVAKITSPSLAKKLPWLHVVNPAFSLLYGFTSGDTPLRQFLLAAQTSSWIGLAMLSAGVVSIVHTALTVRQPAARGQIRWVALGAVSGILPYLFLTGLPELLIGHALLTIEVTAFFLVAMPITMAIAVARYRLFDVDTLALQVFVHFLLGLALVGVYFLLKEVVRWGLMLLTAGVSETRVVFVATAVTATAFWLLRAPVSAYGKRLFSRRSYDVPQLFQWITEKLTSAIRLEQLTTLLTEDLPQQIGAAGGVLWVLDNAGESLVSAADNGSPGLMLSQGLSVWVSHGSEPIVRSAPPDWAPSEILDFMERWSIELALLLQVGERVVGLWGLGQRTGHLSYTTAEVRWIEKLASQVALAVENTELLQRMQVNQHQLEEEIERRTRIMFNDRNRLNAILQNMADALLVTDPTGRMQLVNPAFERLVRLSARSLLGQSLADVLPVPELSAVMAQSLARPGMVYTADMTLDSPRFSASNTMELTELILRASVTTLGDSSAVIFILRDITHEVEVDRMKSEFISTVSHELRTPLTAVLGFTKLISRTFERSIKPALSTADEEVQRAIEQVEHNFEIMALEGEHLTTLINDVLDIAALDAGTLVWNDQPCDLMPLLQEVLTPLRVEAEMKGLTLTVNPDAAPLPLLADPERLKQVLSNLITNAIKFTAQGQVTITTQRVPAGTVIREWNVPATEGGLVSVADTGVGMSPAGLRHLFQRFYQGGDALHGKPRGTGLGLVICHEIVTHYNGKIWAESTPGVGSTFSFILPLT